MPNWCHNTLKVSGEDTEALERFVKEARISDEQIAKAWAEHQPTMEARGVQTLPEEFAQKQRESQPLTFSSFVPEPDVHEDEDPTQLFSGWYGWRIHNWGTKWDASFDGPGSAIVTEDADLDASVETQGATITKFAAFYKFDTAWSPPVPFVHVTSAQFPTLTFTLRYAEVGNGYAGQGIYKAGDIIEETELAVEDVLAPEEMWF